MNWDVLMGTSKNVHCVSLHSPLFSFSSSLLPCFALHLLLSLSLPSSLICPFFSHFSPVPPFVPPILSLVSLSVASLSDLPPSTHLRRPLSRVLRAVRKALQSRRGHGGSGDQSSLRGTRGRPRRRVPSVRTGPDTFRLVFAAGRGTSGFEVTTSEPSADIDPERARRSVCHTRTRR